MSDTTPVPDEMNMYYGLGHGVNKAEALRQDFIFKQAIIKINWDDADLSSELDELFEIVGELAEIAGAKVLVE